VRLLVKEVCEHQNARRKDKNLIVIILKQTVGHIFPVSQEVKEQNKNSR
jgi:hypothetical protein